MKKQQHQQSFISIRTVLLTTVLVLSITSISNVFANRYSTVTAPNNYQELRFKTTFDSDYPSYPDSDNRSRGTVFIYQHANSNAKKIRVSSFSPSVKKATLTPSTSNPFKALYPHIYTATNRTRLANCPMLSFPFELDNDTTTQEWLVSSSTYFCLGQSKQGIDHDAHMWVLQKQANQQYRILMEGDNLMVITQTNHQHYKAIESYLYLNRANPNQAAQCGGAKNTWVYHQGRYQLSNTEYHARDCNYQHAQGAMMDRYHEQFIQAVKPVVDRVMQAFR